uniref:Zinc finger BED domain-containing protein RICESLEEPER-2-like n=1 Tax=Papaver somniferum TaxID=3469 RepID=A0A5B7LKA9_PAPSO|nr:zinc finger BED domain-containing protein RICESLEEPER-2-like [Papaver somniferum]
MDVSDLVETTPTSNVTDSQLPSPATGGTKKRKLTSIVWKGFEQIEEVDPDDPQKIKRLKFAQCKICDRKYSGDPKAGTSHLKRHMDSCLKKNQSADETQTLIAPIGSDDSRKKVKDFQEMISHVKSSIEFIFASSVRYDQFRALCTSMGLKPKKLQLDVKHRWNTTYFMLKDALPYRSAISSFLADRTCSDLTDYDWDIAELLCKFLKPFYDATKHFSGVDYVTSNYVLNYLFRIGRVLQKHMHMNHLKDIIVVMEKKFVKYWGETPILFGIGCILGPRLNLRGLETTLADIQSCFSTSAHVIRCHAEKKSLIVAKLKSLFEEYVIMLNEQMQYGSSINSISNGNQPPLQSVLQMQEETISDDEDDSFWKSRSQNRRDHLSSASEELTRYFAEPEPSTFEEMKNFDILGWWKANEKRYPVLSCIARDVLAVPVSTVASESAFSLGKRVLSDYRSSLTPQMLECCVILKDWWKAELKNRMMTLDPLNDDITPVDDENDVSESSCVSLR